MTHNSELKAYKTSTSSLYINSSALSIISMLGGLSITFKKLKMKRRHHALPHRFNRASKLGAKELFKILLTYSQLLGVCKTFTLIFCIKVVLIFVANVTIIWLSSPYLYAHFRQSSTSLQAQNAQNDLPKGAGILYVTPLSPSRFPAATIAQPSGSSYSPTRLSSIR